MLILVRAHHVATAYVDIPAETEKLSSIFETKQVIEPDWISSVLCFWYSILIDDDKETIRGVAHSFITRN